ncbi:unnamed protein product [Durusdinium trenchii]|uniref:RNA helicase n=1 Tax=Durusdinium trenchii TaxID=1381693 RepID=A0ABP0QZQ7_9DINO
MAEEAEVEQTPQPFEGERIIPKPVKDGDWLKGDLAKIHKDFYLNHPDLSLQCERFCWGNLEAAHPVLGQRSQEEAEEYRKANGIVVQVVRGRPAPKPFQTFQETAFPSFVEELAMELFSAESQGALPFAVQAQAWPCALSGMDLIAVAPTGSGKTLAFLLPALVHIMAQPHVQEGEGPIVLILEPTRELAVQTYKVAQQFCTRTSGEDLIRAGLCFGGVAAQQQTPLVEAPDFGRWPEILVATPGRLLELISVKKWISAKRMSYVVLDEADHMLLTGNWLVHIKQLLYLMRPDRQLLLLSATWPLDADRVASDLCGEELIKIRVNPVVPNIPQEVKLFPGQFDGGYNKKMAELVRWIQEEMEPSESLLVFCHHYRLPPQIAHHPPVLEALSKHVPNSHWHDRVAVLDHAQKHEEQQAQYMNFLQGKVKMLISTFSLAGRGLDFHDPDSMPLSLAVILFDFPSSIGEYANCIGRTSRPGQRGGRVYAFLPEGRFWIAGELIALLEHCGQKVPDALAEQHAQDQKFLSDVKAGMLQLLNQGSLQSDSLCAGEYDAEQKVWTLPSSIPSYRRKLVHLLADELNLPHVSYGESSDRRLYLSHDRDALPDKYFVEGEAVVIRHHVHPEQRGTVANAHINRRFRTIEIRVNNPTFGDMPVDVPVEMVWREGQEPSPFPARPTRENVRRYADYREHRPDYRSDYRSNSNYKRSWKSPGYGSSYGNYSGY